MRHIAYLALVVFVLVHCGANADNACAADPNTPSPDKWDNPIKDPNNPNELVEVKWSSVVSVLSDKAMDTETKAAIVDKIISPVFDFQLMGKLALGKTHWPKLTPPQRDKFMSLFVKRLKTSYREKIMLYDNQAATFEPAVYNKGAAQIAMTLISGSQKTALLYKLRKIDGGWKVYDVEIEGVSILLTYRSQFDDILGRGTVDDLLSQLETPSESKTAPSES